MVEAQRLAQFPLRSLVVSGQPVDGAQVDTGVGLLEPVTEPHGRLGGGGVPGDRVGPRPVPAQQFGQRGGQAHHPVRVSGARQAGQQAGPLSTGPGQRLAGVGQIRQLAARSTGRAVAGRPRRPGAGRGRPGCRAGRVCRASRAAARAPAAW